MKTAVSLPDPIFREAEKLAHLLKKSRSELYREALTEYVARHAPDEVTEAMNKVADEIDTRLDAFGRKAARQALTRNEW